MPNTMKMSKKDALEYVANSHPDHPIYQKALLVLKLRDNQLTRFIAWSGLAVSLVSLLVNALKH